MSENLRLRRIIAPAAAFAAVIALNACDSKAGSSVTHELRQGQTTNYVFKGVDCDTLTSSSRIATSKIYSVKGEDSPRLRTLAEAAVDYNCESERLAAHSIGVQISGGFNTFEIATCTGNTVLGDSCDALGPDPTPALPKVISSPPASSPVSSS